MSFTFSVVKLRAFINQERAYMLMLSFILLINALGMVAEKIPDFKTAFEAKRTTRSVEANRPKLKFEALKDEQLLLAKLREGNNQLVILLNLLSLAILFVFSLGLFLDIRILMAGVRKKEIFKAPSAHQRVSWGIFDIFKLAIIFVFLGYILHMLEALIFPGLKKQSDYAFFPILNTGVMDLVLLGSIIYFVKVKYRQGLVALGLRMKDWARNILLAVISYIAFVPILAGILLLVVLVAALLNYQPPEQPVFRVFLEGEKLWFLIFSTLMVVILGPIVEEVFFRGFAYNAIKRRWGKELAMLLTAVIFAALHANLAGFFPILALGYLLVYMYEQTGSLISSIVIHMMHNGAMVGLLFLGRHFMHLLESG